MKPKLLAKEAANIVKAMDKTEIIKEYEYVDEDQSGIVNELVERLMESVVDFVDEKEQQGTLVSFHIPSASLEVAAKGFKEVAEKEMKEATAALLKDMEEN